MSQTTPPKQTVEGQTPPGQTLPDQTLPDHNLQILLAARPEGRPDENTFETARPPIEEPAEGEVLVRVTNVSIDPAMRGWMDDRKSYIPPVAIGAVMRALGVGEIVRSAAPGFAVGDRVSGSLGLQAYARVAAEGIQQLPPGVDDRSALGPLGMVGMTAYFGLLEVGTPKAGETVLVSGAAGAVGSLVGQIAKIKGCRVVGIAGTDEKCHWIEHELGFDAAINYKTANDLGEAIRSTCPQGVDVYFDNVGGEVLDAALRCIAYRARVVICGAISQYNNRDATVGPANYLALLVQRARMEGFIVFDYAKRYGEAAKAIGGWLAEGKIRYRYDVLDGLESAPRALLRLFEGGNTGKLIISVDAL